MKASRTLAALVAVLLWLGGSTHAAPWRFTLSDPKEVFSLRDAAQALDDPSGQLTLDDVLHPAAGAFKAVSSLSRSSKYITRWYRFVLFDRAPLGTHWFVAASPEGRSAELYYPRSNGSFGEIRFGWDIPFRDRPVRGQLPLAALTQQMFGKPLYLRVVQPAKIFPELRSSERATDYDVGSSGFLIGFLVALCLASFLLALRLRSAVFFWNAVMLLFAALLEAIVQYFAPEYLWPTLSIPLDAAGQLTTVGFLVALTIYSRAIIGQEYRPRWFDTVVWPMLAFLAAAFISRIFIFSPATAALEEFGSIPWFAALMAAAIFAYRRGHRAMRFYIAGLAPWFVAWESVGATFFGLGNFTTAFWLQQSGMAFNAMMFQLAIADQLLLANREREGALSDLARERQHVIETQTQALQDLESHNRAFERFVPQDFLKQLGRGDIVNVELGDHVEREMAVLFGDIRAFSAISEAMTPQEAFDFVNGYFARVGPVVREHGGFVDKFVGDAVMALFDRPQGAIDAAIALQHEVRRFNEARARQFLQPIGIGVGIHFGRLMLGTVGEPKRMDTTVMSDVVTVAARIEGLTKLYGAAIVVTEALLARLENKDAYCLRPLGSVQVKGTSRAVGICEVCDADIPEVLLAKIADTQRFEEALNDFSAGNFERSRENFAHIADREPRDGPAKYFAERARSLSILEMRPVDWDGVERLDSK